MYFDAPIAKNKEVNKPTNKTKQNKTKLKNLNLIFIRTALKIAKIFPLKGLQLKEEARPKFSTKSCRFWGLCILPQFPLAYGVCVCLPLEAAQNPLSWQKNSCRLGILLPWALNILTLQKWKWVWVSDRDPELFPVHWIHSQGCFRAGIREGAEGISCFWILPMLPGSYRAALGMHGCSDGGLWGVKITDVSDCDVYPYVI